MMPLPSFSALLSPTRMVSGLEAASKAEVLERCAGLLTGDDRVRDPDTLLADLRAREAQLSTGVGEGLALPHARTEAVSGTVAALATLATPVEWDALDGRPVDLVVMIAGPEAARAEHVRLMAQVSRVLAAAGLRPRLAEAETAEEALAAIRDAEGG